MELKQLEQLETEFVKFKANLKNTKHQHTKDTVAFLEKHTGNEAFQIFALLKMDRDKNLTHTQNLASQIWDMQDHISELLGRGAEVIKERDELLEAIKIHAPDWKSKLLWCVEVAEEPDSPFEQVPAASKEIAQRAVKRYKEINKNSYSKDLAECADGCIRIAMWDGTTEDHAENMLFDDAWFSLPMFVCQSPDRIDMAFKAQDLVECEHKGQTLITKDIDEARRFFEVV